MTKAAGQNGWRQNRGPWLLMCCLCLSLATLIVLSRHQVTHGTVVSRRVYPEETTTIMMPQYDSKGRLEYFMPVTIYYPESYGISVEGRTSKGQLRTEEFFVEKGQYDQLYIGGEFTCGSRGEKQCKNERPQENR